MTTGADGADGKVAAEPAPLGTGHGQGQPGSARPSGHVADGAFEVAMDPFARHRKFAGWVRTGKLRSTFQWFLDAWREPIDVRADKILDLAAFGRVPHPFLKMPRPKRNDELPEGHEDRLKKDLERQFILRNLMRFVKTVNKDDPLEFEKRAVGVKIDLDTRAHLKDLHRKADLIDELGVEHVKHGLAWRHRMLEVMQWERYFCAEIKQDFQGPLWKHDPETNPIQSRQIDDTKMLAQPAPADAPTEGEEQGGPDGDEG